MVYIKVVVFACLVAAVCGGHHGVHYEGGGGGVLGGATHLVKGIGGGLGKEILCNPLGAIGGILKDLAKGVGATLGVAGAVVHEILCLHIPAAIDDVFNIVRVVLKTVAKIVGHVIPGLGHLLETLAKVITGLATCLLGSPGITGALLGHKPHGKFNPHHLHCHGVPKHGKDCVDLTKHGHHFGIKGLIELIEKLLKTILHGKHGGHLPKSLAIVVNCLTKILGLLKCKDFSKHHITDLLVHILTLIGSILNGVNPGSGILFIKICVHIFDPHIKKCGIHPLSSKVDDIWKHLKGSEESHGCWKKGHSGHGSGGHDILGIVGAQSASFAKAIAL